MLLELAAELRARHERRDVEREERFVGDGVGHFAARDARASPSMMALLPTPASPIRIGLFFLRREDLHHAFDLLLAAYDRVDLPLAGQPRKVHAELVQQVGRAFLLVPVLLAEVEHVNLHFGVEVVAHGEFFCRSPDTLSAVTPYISSTRAVAVERSLMMASSAGPSTRSGRRPAL